MYLYITIGGNRMVCSFYIVTHRAALLSSCTINTVAVSTLDGLIFGSSTVAKYLKLDKNVCIYTVYTCRSLAT